ncbi:fatty acyl-CoA reductase wat [Drosophila biarmipes]|uniref:fatty acyl-CoA reductase wat n=1 Tax=Drosophila biarmipes TaxID=125945 RepID=UPI0007E69C97|nr:fatty acyl-CoA reductase wat [Drosophila biarmipes]
MSSEIVSFYKDKTVFLTGGTGLLGKVIIEKLLRSTDVKRIYMLVRAKRGEKVEGRFEAWKKDQVFEVLLKNKPHALEHVTPISGDCCAPEMALSQADRSILIAEVQVVIHGAASVRFIEPLQQAININTRAVRLMVQLAKEMRRLEAFVHISTAFSNCVAYKIEERFYPEHLTCPVDKVLDLTESLSGETLETMAPALLGKYPNTYTYTKALGEQVIQEEAKDLPVGIFRPAIITSTFKEPVRGWIDGLQGLIALVFGSAYGIVRLVLVNLKVNVPVVPADYCVNVAIASAAQIAKIYREDKKSAIPIYAYSSCESNSLTYGDLSEQCFQKGMLMPNENMIWYPFNHNTACPYVYDIGTYFYHFLPGFLIDIALRLKGQKAVMVERYRKIDEGMKSLFPFTRRNFEIKTNHTDQLWQSMSPEDKETFNFDMSSLNWDEYFINVMYGVRLYLFKESPTEESVAKGKRNIYRLYVLDRVLRFVMILAASAFLWFLYNLALN